MKKTYGLKEVMVPENAVLDKMEKQLKTAKKYDRTAKCNVFMSAEFYKPSEM